MWKALLAAVAVAGIGATTATSTELVVPTAEGPFGVATREELATARIPTRLVGQQHGQPVVVSFEETPSTRWSASQGSFPRFVVHVLSALGDTNARYIDDGKFEVTSGPRRILVEAIVGLRAELSKRGLVLNLIRLSRDEAENDDVDGDPNSDHKIGLAFDASVTIQQCAENDQQCRTRAKILGERRLERHFQILSAAQVVGVQQLNLYGKLKDVAGESLHVGVSLVRNGALGEMVGDVSAEGTRRIGYGEAQKGQLGALTRLAARYISADGIAMKDVFDKVLHNESPVKYKKFYDAVREGKPELAASLESQ